MSSTANSEVEKDQKKNENEDKRQRNELGEWRKGEIIGKGAYGTVYMGLNLKVAK